MLCRSLVGKRVAFVAQNEWFHQSRNGAYAEFITTSAEAVMKLPDELSYEQGCSSFVNPLTALGLLEKVQDVNGTATIITAAASQLGRMIIRLCQSEGITPICTVRRSEQVEVLRSEFGVQHVVNTSDEDWE